MRGEETQMAGLQSSSALTAVLPGTHSKWIRMEGDTITLDLPEPRKIDHVVLQEQIAQGERVRDQFALLLPPTLPAGEYELRVERRIAGRPSKQYSIALTLKPTLP